MPRVSEAQWTAAVLYFDPQQRILAVSRQPPVSMRNRNYDWWLPSDKPKPNEEPYATALRALSERTGMYTFRVRPLVTISDALTNGLGPVHVYTPETRVYGKLTDTRQGVAQFISIHRFLNNVVDPRRNMYLANRWLLQACGLAV